MAGRDENTDTRPERVSTKGKDHDEFTKTPTRRDCERAGLGPHVGWNCRLRPNRWNACNARHDGRDERLDVDGKQQFKSLGAA